MNLQTFTIDLDTHAIVPREPTEEMCKTGDDCQDADPKDASGSFSYWTYRAMIAAAPPYQSAEVNEMAWIPCSERLPAISQIVDLCIAGVVQNETYMFDSCDVGDYGLVQNFWSRDDDSDGIDVESGQFWKARPSAPKGEE